MNLHVFCIHISIMLLLQYALSKTLPDAREKDSDENDSPDDTESIHETNHGSFKHSKSNRFKGHIRRRRANEEQSKIKKQCAVMYKNDEPVGILQPYKDSYQFLPIHSDEHIPVEISPFADSQNSFKRDTYLNTDGDEDVPELEDETLKKTDESSPFSDDRYPYIFAKFKVDSRIEKTDGNTKQRALHKRESSVDEKRSDSLSSTLSKIQTNDEGAEVELRSILNDMGLIEDKVPIDKREAELNEDEDLEHGTNKINLIKLHSDDERPKREDSEEKTVEKRAEAATKHYERIEIPEPKAINEEEYIDQYLNKNDEEKEEEKSKKAVEKRSDDVAAEMEREIKAKLQKIKEEVRNEIDQIKDSNNEEFEEGGEENKEKTQEEEKSQRRKRHVISTLIDAETSDINPLISADNSLIPHVRRRRKRSLLDENDDNSGNISQEFRNISKNEEIYLSSKKDIDTNSVLVIDETETTTIIDLNPETQVTPKPCTVKASVLGKKEKKNSESTSNDEYNHWIDIDDRNNNKEFDELKAKQANEKIPVLLKMYDLIRNRIIELENLEHERSIENRSLNNPTGNSSQESTTPTNHYYATTERFFIRNLQQYDELRNEDDANFKENNIKDDNLDVNKEENINKEKRSCKCSNGDKDCKCGKAPVKLLKGDNVFNFVYIDDIPRLVGEPESKISENGEKNDKDPVVKMKLLPLPSEKRRSPKDNLKDRKSRINFEKNLLDGGYTLDIDPDIYRITEENPKSFASRNKRNSFSELVEIHGGGPVINHLVAIRERSMLPRIRIKRNAKTKDQADQLLTLTDMSDEDLFGALPQSFEGELARHKRVKRRGYSMFE